MTAYRETSQLTFEYDPPGNPVHNCIIFRPFLFSLQELEFVKFAKKQKVQELTEAKKGLKKEVERLRIERDIKSQELEEERKHTSLQMTTACKTTNPLKVRIIR